MIEMTLVGHKNYSPIQIEVFLIDYIVKFLRKINKLYYIRSNGKTLL